MLQYRNHFGEVGFTDIEDGLSIQIKIVMGDYIAHAFRAFPIDLGIAPQQIRTRGLVEVLKTFPSCNELHADRVEFFQSVFRIEEEGDRINGFKAAQDAFDRVQDRIEFR